MNIKTQELVTAGYALAKVLDVESATLVKQLADALAVQRVRADELNRQVVNLAVENAELKSVIEAVQGVAEQSDGIAGWHLNGEIARWGHVLPEILDIETSSTESAIVEIQAQGVEKFAKEMHADITAGEALEFAEKLRKGAAV